VAAIGAGDSESREENETFGLGFGTVDDRIERLAAAVRAVRDRGARTWVGGSARAVRDVAAAEADGWNSWGGSAERFGTQAAAVRAGASRPAFTCSWGGLFALGDDDSSARDTADRLGAGAGTIVGGPETVARVIDAYARAGADWVIVAPIDARDPVNATLLGGRVREALASG
jgi:alkanesulfonate monooxygenase SsuD/methylene tetrahydromethanopterin reductase-like flavin-dependent oxidoreductase (luciferase family)